MINKIDIHGEVVDEWTRKYAEKRVKRLDKYMGKDGKKEVAAKLSVAQISKPYGNKYEMTLEITAPGDIVYIAKEQVANMISGVDILEAKIVGQMRKAKTKASQKTRGISKKISGLFGKRKK